MSEAPSAGWFCTTYRRDFALHLTAPGRRPIIYRAVPKQGAADYVLARHDGPETVHMVLTPGLPVQIVPGLWISASKNSLRTICVHADPSVRTSRLWHYHLEPKEI